jgi:hypothetical protein
MNNSYNLQRITYLEEVIAKIKKSRGKESEFDNLYELLNNEYLTQQNGNVLYLNDLRQTISKQAKGYIRSKASRPIKGSPNYFADFLINFEIDISNEIHRLKLDL